MSHRLTAAFGALALVLTSVVMTAGPAQAAGPSIHGIISRDGSASHAGLQMTLYRIDSGTDVAISTGIPDAMGNYTFDNLVVGATYTLYYYDTSAGSQYANEYWSNAPSRSLATGIVISAGSNITANAALSLGSTVTGHIVEGAGQVASNGAYVVLRFMTTPGAPTYATGRNGTTDAAGNFTITNVFPGQYQLEITKNTYNTEYWNDWQDASRSDPYPATSGMTGPTANIWLRSTTQASLIFFQDAPTTSPFYTPIDWMGRQGLSGGTAVTYERPLFKPVDAVSRQAMASFMFRLSTGGTYTPPATATFADVPTTHPFYAAIEWMYANGISTGSANPGGGKPLFKPTDPVSRQAMALFLFRLGNPSSYMPTGQRFADVPTTSTYYQATSWLFDEEISTGTAQPSGLPLYKPLDPVSRQAMAAFLYRYAT